MKLRHDVNRRRYPARRLLLLAMIAAGVSLAAFAGSIKESLQFLRSSKDYVELAASPGVAVDLRYATTNNLFGKNMYGKFNRAFVHRIAAEKLTRAAHNLQRVHPKYRLVILDALRPRSVQYLLWEQVKGTNKEAYVANPVSGSIHNFGFALDLSVLDENGRGLDMGTAYDDFSPVSQPQLEERYVKEGRLTAAQIRNRRILRKAMEDAGFIQLQVEWWHYDALPKNEVRGRYKIVE